MYTNDVEAVEAFGKKYKQLNVDIIWRKYIIHNTSLDFNFLLNEFILYNKYVFNDIDWDLLSTHVHVKYIDKYINYPWNFKEISDNPYLNLSFMKKYRYKNWNMYILSNNKFINFDIIEYFNDWNWDSHSLSRHPNLTFDFIKKNYCKHLRWIWLNISMNKNMTLKIIEDNDQYPWDIDGISLNPNLTIEYILYKMHLGWSWDNISMNKNVVNENVLIDNINLPWTWNKICEHINLSANFISKYINIMPLWNWNSYSSNIHFDFKCLEIFPDVNFNWYAISKNPNITIEIYEKYKHKLIRRILLENHYEFNTCKIQNIHDKYIHVKYQNLLSIFTKYINKDFAKQIILFMDNSFIYE
jgi:hypothetical protein